MAVSTWATEGGKTGISWIYTPGVLKSAIDCSIIWLLETSEKIIEIEESKIQEGELTVVKIRGGKVLVTRLESGEVVAFSGECPHAAADLSAGDLHRGKITCPDHDWKFDIKTGKTLYPSDEFACLKKFQVETDGSTLQIKTDD